MDKRDIIILVVILLLIYAFGQGQGGSGTGNNTTTINTTNNTTFGGYILEPDVVVKLENWTAYGYNRSIFENYTEYRIFKNGTIGYTDTLTLLFTHTANTINGGEPNQTANGTYFYLVNPCGSLVKTNNTYKYGEYYGVHFDAPLQKTNNTTINEYWFYMFERSIPAWEIAGMNRTTNVGIFVNYREKWGFEEGFVQYIGTEGNCGKIKAYGIYGGKNIEDYVWLEVYENDSSLTTVDKYVLELFN